METKGIRRWINAVILVLAIFLIFLPAVKVHATESSGTCGENLTWMLTEDGTLTISGTGEMSDFNFLGGPWEKTSVKKVLIQAGISSIGDYAFCNCEGLIDVSICNTVTNIGDYAFQNCSSLSTIVIPNSVTSVGEGVFDACRTLTNVVIPDSLSKLSINMFRNCKKLDNVIIPNSITTICNGAFTNCSNLKNITIPDSVTSIFENFAVGGPFAGCSSLVSITLPNSVTAIPEGTFSGCSNLSSIRVSEQLDIIGANAFCDCVSLEEIELPGVTTLGSNTLSGVFSGCVNLKKIISPKLTVIGANTFTGCSALETIVVSESLSSVGSSAFNGCYRLKDISGWNVDNKVNTISTKAFKDMSALTDFYIPRNVTTIKDYAFLNCSSLLKVGIPVSCSVIETGAFRNCPIKDVYYEGTRDQWNTISIGAYNESLAGATIHFEAYDVYPQLVTSVKIDQGDMSIEVGSSTTLTATIEPDNAANKNVTWSSSNANKATVNENGMVTGVAVGTTIITVKTVDQQKTHSCSITVNPVKVTGVILDKETLSLVEGETATLVGTVQPENAANKRVTWRSDNTSIAAVSSEGVVTARASGTANITVTTYDQQKTASCLITVSAKPDPIEAFVSRMYTVALGREAEEAGLNDWVGQLRNGTNDGAGLAHGFIESQEFIGKNHSNEEYLNILYHTFFDRDPDEGGYNSWLSQLNSGASRRHVLAGFVNSQEFTNLCGRFNINRGTLPDDENTNAQVRAFVERMYVKALGRSGEEDGINSWTQRIVSGEWAAADVAKAGFFNSPEYAAKNRSNEDFVEDLYQALFDRASDEAGKADWLSRLAGGASREEIMNGFGGSQEFTNMLAGFGL